MNILSFSGFIPEQICDTVRFIQYAGNHKISHYCGYAADFISQVLSDSQIDGAVFPRTCDSSRVISSYLAESGKFIHQLHIPARQDMVAVSMLRDSIMTYQRAIETHYNVTISDISERIEIVNVRNRTIAELYESISEFSYSAYLDMLHKMLQKPLREQSVQSSLLASAGSGKRIYLIGSLLSNPTVVAAIEHAGMVIVGDRLTESKRLFSAPPVHTEGDIYENIARSLLHNKLSPTQNCFKIILQEDFKEIQQKKVQGVIFVTQKYCEPYDYLFSVYKKMLDELKIPVLKLVLSDSTDNRKAEFAIEAFADI